MLRIQIETNPIVLKAQGEALVAMAKGIEAERKRYEKDAPTRVGTVEPSFPELLHAVKTINLEGLDEVATKVLNDLKKVVEVFETEGATVADFCTEPLGEAHPGKLVVVSTPSEAVEAFGADDAPPPPPPPSVRSETTHPAATDEDDAPPPPPPAAAPTVELDAAGLPFDARIHGSGRTVYASGANKGNWKAKRQVDPELVVKVEAELRAALAVPGPTAEQLEELPPTEIATILQFVTACTTKGLSPLEVTEACKKHGVEGVPLLAVNPKLIPLVAAELGL